MSQLAAALQFIQKIERENPRASAYEIANQLRGYTKAEYTSRLWTLATGYNQKYIEGEFQGKLNLDVVMSGQVTDFAHFIASLSDQINQPKVNLSDLTNWTGDHTSWAGDIGSAITFYYSQSGKTKAISLKETLNRLASDSDYTADIAAYLVGAIINSGAKPTVSSAIAQYNAIPYTENIKAFLKKRFDGIIEGNKLKNPAEIEAEIRQSVSTYLRLYSSGTEIFKSVQNLLRLQPKPEMENTKQPNASDLLQGSIHFLTHIVKQGGLDSLNFKPYQMPGLPWLLTVDYSVRV
jgi:hypothetical protein